MKYFFLRTVAYAGLYAEIFAASCRWLSSVSPGWSRRARWKSYVTEALVAAFYLPPTCEEVKAAQEQRRINGEHEALSWIAKQPETIQTCLKYDPVLLEKAYRSRTWRPEMNIDKYPLCPECGAGYTQLPPAIPEFVKPPYEI